MQLRKAVAATAGAILTVGTLAACSGNAEGDESITVTLGHPFPDGHLMEDAMIVPLQEELESATGGSVKIEIVPGGALGAGDVVYENTVSGAQQVGMGLQGTTPGRFPLTDAFGLPFLFDSAESATTAMWDAMDKFPEFQEEYDDVHLLALWSADMGELFTTEKKVVDVADVEGLKLRAASQAQLDLVDAAGGSGVVLAAADMLDSLDRGLIDGVLLAGTGPKTQSMTDKFEYGLIGNFYATPLFMSMNKDVWEGLSDEQQKAFNDIAGRELSLLGAKAYDAAYVEDIKAVEEAGAEFTELEGEARADWEAIGDQVAQKWVDRTTKDGLPAQEFYDFLVED